MLEKIKRGEGPDAEALYEQYNRKESEVSDDSRGIGAAKLEAVGADQTRDWDEDSPGRIKKIYKTFCVIFYFKFIILEKLDLTI